MVLQQLESRGDLSAETIQAIKDAWLEVDFTDVDLPDPFESLYSSDEDFIKRFVYLLSQPENFHILCKYIFNIELPPIQNVILQEVWNKRFPMLCGSRGLGKTFLLSLYSMLRAFLMPGRKIVVVGAAFRQSKFLFDYMKGIWDNAPVLRDLCQNTDGPKASVDRCIFHINGSTVTCLPLGNGDKIRGQRANDIICDEFASVPREIFETVVAGFANVASSPIDKVKQKAMLRKCKELGIELTEIDFDVTDKGNQIVFSGTAYYNFNHFAEYWKRWKKIIHSGGNVEALKEIFKGKAPGPDFNWKDYLVLRIPYDVLPAGFLDAAQIARARATVHTGTFQMEYGAIFTTDSTGYYKRSMIEKCVVGPNSSVDLPISGNPFFTATLEGSKNKKYVYGIDANAQGSDNFCIIVLEVHEDHRRIVYGWTTNTQKHKKAQSKSATEEQNYYSYCARKIRNLMKVFPCEELVIDSQGGGYALYEALHDKDKLQDNEQLIWQNVDPDKAKPSDDYTGLHMVRLINFADSKWMSESNQTMRKDFEDKVLLFPYFDSLTLGLSYEKDEIEGRTFDTLEDAVFEIEKLKDELAMIVHTETASGRDKFDTPETIIGVGKKEKVRKDRYSALLMANWGARLINAYKPPEPDIAIGGWAGDRDGDFEYGADMYNGPDWWVKHMKKENPYG